MTEEEPLQQERKPVKAVFREGKIWLIKGDDANTLLEKGYGEKQDGDIHLPPFEALYLLTEGWLTVRANDEEDELSFQELLTRCHGADKTVWARYLVYRDLRQRGYVVKPGFGLGIDFRVYDRGTFGKEAAKFIIYGVFEGEPVPIQELVNAVNTAQNLKKEIVLGVIERRGEIVYYSLSQFNV